MEANLRIIKSIKKLNEELLQSNKALEETKEEFEKEIKNINVQQENSKQEQNNIKNELLDKINTIELTPGPKGEPGEKGKDGRDGLDGRDGERGLPGKDGVDGKNGKDGRDGKDGIGTPGVNGKDGVGILSAKVNNDGDLIITLTNKKVINAGHVKGQNGGGINGINGRDGSDGISVTKAEIREGYLYITLSNGEEINAGYVGGTGPGEEVDPVFTASVAYNITDEDVTSWDNKSEFSGNYEDLSNKPTIPTVPTDVSAFDNDVGYLKQNYYSVVLNPDGTVNTYSQELNYQTIKNNLQDSKINDILEIMWVTTKFNIQAIEETDGDIKFIGDIEFDGIQRRMVFTLNSNNQLTTTLITTNEIVSNKRTSVVNNLSDNYYPSTNAVYNEFQRKPVLIYDKVDKLHVPGTITAGTDDNNGLLNQNQGEGTTRTIQSWNITGMNLSEFKRIRVVYSRNDGTSAVTGEFFIPLDADYITDGNLNAYVNGASLPYYAVRTRLVGINCAISSDKTSFSVTQTISLTATTLGMVATTVNDMFVTKIEGYYD